MIIPKKVKHIKEYSRAELEQRYLELEQKNESLSARLQWYEEQFRLSRQQRFGSSSEKSMPDQISIFNEPEAETVVFCPEPAIEEVIVKPKKKKKGHKASVLKDFPKEIIEYRLSAEEDCTQCGEELHEMSKQVRAELTVIPAKVSVTEHVSYIYSCRSCEKQDITVPVIKAKAPAPVITKSLASPSLVSYIMTRKYMEALPLYRQEQQFKHNGIRITRQTMANWMIKASHDWLKLLYEKMHEKLQTKDILHADETEVEVLCEPNRPASKSSYMWMYRTSGDSVPIILFNYREGRSGSYPKEFLKNFSGYLHVDGYAGYNKLENVTLAGCWAHARRKYDEALKSIPKNTESALTACQEGLAYCNRLFEIERSLCDLDFTKRKEERQRLSRPVVEAYFAWLHVQKELALPQSYLGKAITYSLNQKEKLVAFLEDGRIEVSNNRAERSIKPFVIGRKNWLFSNTPKGATASAMIYSIIETAKENKLKPFEYLIYIFEQLPNSDISDDTVIANCLPWSKELPDYCRTT